MKKLLFLLLFVTSVTFGQIKIEPIKVGLPEKFATDLMVRVLPFETTSVTCDLYYELKSIDGVVLWSGNLHLNMIEFAAWGQDMLYIENLALNKLNLIRKED